MWEELYLQPQDELYHGVSGSWSIVYAIMWTDTSQQHDIQTLKLFVALLS